MAFEHGVDDLVLLEDISNDGILATLKKRYNANLIYTYIGQVLIAINPYQQLGIYSEQVIKTYQGRYIFEEPPHVYSIAEHAYHSLLTEGQNQCIIISGESGSGKTETSKFIMKYIAAVTGKSKSVQRVKEQILESNPVLEAFGNAKTVQNNNSSRFGKYFEIQFNYGGDPTGGRITNYLLEKSRVVFQAQNERNFHIFYQLIAGASASQRQEMQLGDPSTFNYLNQSGCFVVDGMNDAAEFRATKHAMDVIGLAEEEQNFLFKMVAAVLHLGNLEFEGSGETSKVKNRDVLKITAKLLGQQDVELEKSLTSRTVTAGGASSTTQEYNVPLGVEKALYTRDALAKAIYSQMFDWLVQRINESICDHTSEFNIGVLDIYGFEIFQDNSFEQLCINYVNEKLHQIFIDLTLKEEQEEYIREGIKWESVDYFDNRPCVELIEGRGGVMSLLDEECLFPKGTDQSFLEKLNRQCKSNPYFHPPSGKAGDFDTFTLDHYAGKVTYTVGSFLDKNKDTLFRDLRDVLTTSNDPLLSKLFPKDAFESKKRPPTAGTQFRNQVTALVSTLRSCTPHYIRCIRPNTTKSANKMEDELTSNQIRYLGLLENVRVRRAGYAYRQTFAKFMHRFRILSNKTFPTFNGTPSEGVEVILQDCHIKQSGKSGSSTYEMGKTKIFIRNPQTLFTLEELRLQKLNDIVKIIQGKWRDCRGKAFARRVRNAIPEVFWGQKERRRDSIFRQYKGDYIKAKGSRLHKSISKKFTEKRVVFADKVNMLEKGKPKPRVMIISEGALYLIGGTFRKKVTHRIAIPDIESIQLSDLADGVVVINNQSSKGSSIAFETPKKTEVVGAIYEISCEIARENGDRQPKGVTVTFCSGEITFQSKHGKRTLQFSKEESLGDKVEIKAKGSVTSVSTGSGLDKSAGPKKRQKAAKAQQDRQINRTGVKRGMPVVCKVKAQHDYEARNARELSFRAGDIINVTQKSSSGTWQGELNGKTGAFPATYVLEIS
ncbi:unconventional myosin-Ia [Balamuthia mandrillaris]